MNIKRNCCALLAGLLAGAAGIVTAHASTMVTFSVDMGTNILNGTFVAGTDTVSVHGSFDGWGAGLNLVQEGSSTVYTNTANDAADADGSVLSYKFVNSHSGLPNGGYEDTADYNNRAVVLPAAGGSLVLPTPFFGDAGASVTQTVMFQVDMSQQINLGAFTNDSSTLDVRGNFNGWTGQVDPLTRDTSILRTNQYGLVTSNVYTATVSVSASPYAAMDYKFVQNNNFEGTATLHDGGNNRFFTMPDAPLTLPVVYFNDADYAPVAQVTFSVDMSIVSLTDTNFDPSSVTINGDFTGWNGVALTNDPTAANTNIYTSPPFSAGVGSTINYQFRYTQLSDGTIVYDHLNGADGGGGNRSFVVPNVSSTNVPAVVFNDASMSDYLLKPTPVFFSVDMSWATTNDLYTGTNKVGMFNPATDNVYINGQFANWYTWQGGFPPPPAASPAYQMHEVGLSLIYTNTIVLPAGTSISFNYKYGTDPYASYGGPVDDEAAFGQNHYRVVRSTASGAYSMPPDTFGTMYAEPYFYSGNTTGAQLQVGMPSGGSVPVTWLGRPGAELQVSSDLTGGTWQTLTATDGTNWTAGYNSTNGFVSQTNWPTSDRAFFRLVKP